MNTQFVLCIIHSSQYLMRERLTVATTAVGFWKEGSFAECVPWEISDTCVDTKPRGIEATYIIISYTHTHTHTHTQRHTVRSSHFVIVDPSEPTTNVKIMLADGSK